MTVSDIARAVGLSITTVSFILNGKAKERKISDRATKRVLDYVKRAGYKPSQFVRKVPVGQEKVIGLLLPDLQDGFWLAVGKQLEHLAWEAGYRLVFMDYAGDRQKAAALTALCVGKELDGVALFPPEHFEESIVWLKERLPVVLLECYEPDLQCAYVVADNRTAAYQVTKQLLDLDCKRIGFVSLYTNQTHLRERQQGYMDAVDASRLQAFIRKLDEGAPLAEIQEAVCEFVHDNRLDAVLFALNGLALPALPGLQKASPDLRISTFDNHPVFDLLPVEPLLLCRDAAVYAQQIWEALCAGAEKAKGDVSQLSIPFSMRFSTLIDSPLLE